MTDERKRELEKRLDTVVTELKEVVEEMSYGVSIMVLPSANGSNICKFIHECGERRGLMEVHGSFEGALNREFEYDEEDV